MQKEKTTRAHKLAYFGLLFTVALAAASVRLDLLAYLYFSLYAALACAALFRLYHPASAAVAPVLSFLLMGALLDFSFTTFVLSLLPCAVGFALAMSLRTGEGRLSTVFSATAAAAVVLVGYLALALYEQAGGADFVSYVTQTIDTLRADFVTLQMESYAEAAKLLEARGIPYTLPTESALDALAGQMMAMIPAAFTVALLAVSLALTYALQLLSMLFGDKRLFGRANARYTVSPFLAAAYLLVSLVTLFYTDFSSPFYLVCINTGWVLSPILAFAALLKAPQLIGFIRRMSRSTFDFAIWMILLILCAISYLSHLFILLAVWQAIHILISALRSRPKSGMQ